VRLSAGVLPAQAAGPKRRSMISAAYLISANVVAGRPEAREDAFEFDHQWAAIQPACEAAGFQLQPLIWTETEPDALAAFDLAIIGPVWDYSGQPQRFLAYCEAVAERTRLLNPPSVLRWNLDKRYLRALEQAGAPIIPTVWADAPDQADIDAAFSSFDADELIVKPVVAVGGEGQQRLSRSAPALTGWTRGAAMIQPFQPAILSEGEFSFLFFGGRFSHALQKRAAPGEYRIQSIYGGYEELVAPSGDDLALAARCVDAGARLTGQDTLLYARVDMVRRSDGALALMELELIEPYFYPRQGPDCGPAFARALASMAG